MIETLADIALVYAAAACLAFVVTYHVLADWRSTPLGRNIMALMFVAAVLLSIGVIRAFFPEVSEHLPVVRAVGYSAIGYVVTRRLYLLLVEQRVIRQNREDARE